MWAEQSTAADRLALIEQIVDDQPPRRFTPSLRNAYEEAWSDLLAATISGTRPQLVAQRADTLERIDLDESASVYVPVPNGEHQEQLLGQTALPVVPIREIRHWQGTRRPLPLRGHRAGSEHC